MPANLRRRLRRILIVALAVATLPALSASPVHKCVVNGTVTFQSSPCAGATPSRQPTVEALNAERKRRLAEAAAQTASAPRPAALAAAGASPPTPAAEAPASPPEPTFRCDGRQHCSQMRSCAEARYFLAHCPGVKMDGNRNGRPCEQQWCTHPLAK